MVQTKKRNDTEKCTKIKKKPADVSGMNRTIKEISEQKAHSFADLKKWVRLQWKKEKILQRQKSKVDMYNTYKHVRTRHTKILD